MTHSHVVRPHSTRESGRLPGEVTCGKNGRKKKKENDVRVSSERQSVCRLRKKKTMTRVSRHTKTHTRTHTQNAPPCTPALHSHTSHVPRCEKDRKAPAAKSLPKLPKVPFFVRRVAWSEGLWYRKPDPTGSHTASMGCKYTCIRWVSCIGKWHYTQTGACRTYSVLEASAKQGTNHRGAATTDNCTE